MTRWIWFWLYAVLGMAILVCGLLVPAHLRAVDVGVIAATGGKGHSLVSEGLELARAGNPGAAQMLLQAAKFRNFPDSGQLESVVGGLVEQYPDAIYWGDPKPAFAGLFSGREPFTELIVKRENRGPALKYLDGSRDPIVRELLRCRELTNTVIFPPSSSTAGQAFDAAVAVTGLLLDNNRLAKGLRDVLAAQVATANGGGGSQRLEETLEDLISLGQRFTWSQLTAFAGRIEDTDMLRVLAESARDAGEALPLLFSAVTLSGNPAGVTGYLTNFSKTGALDLGASSRFGGGAVNELIRRNRRLDNPGVAGWMPARALLGGFLDAASEWTSRAPGFALSLKWFFYLLAGFLLAGAVQFARPPVPELERPLQVRGANVVREILFALGFLLVVLLLSEPFLAQESQKVAFPLRVRLPGIARAVAGGNTSVKTFIMNPTNLFTLLLFFVLQALIYLACLLKLAEIRRQQVPARVKLKLLENEEHLFDAGLYLGFAGTILSLILVSMHFISFTLMAAYSSTSFGIIFVSVFKIFHLRPARRTLLMEAEAANAASEAQLAANMALHT